MAQILSNKEIEKLLDNEIILEGDRGQIRSNSYVFRLGKEVRFFSTKERKAGDIGDILIINPGDSALVHSYEIVDFTQPTIDKFYKGHQICAFLTPTTTLVREALQLPSTKIDPGYTGSLNWTIRNSSVEEIKMEMGEPIFKATFFLLIEDKELPDQLYGDREERDYYQDKAGLVESKRRLPVDIKSRKQICVSSKGTELERLKQSGFPYDFIATQLQQVGDHLVIVTKDFSRIDAKVEKQNRELSQKIDDVQGHILKVIAEKFSIFVKDVDNMIFSKLVFGGISFFSILLAMAAGVKYLIDKNLSYMIAPSASIAALLGLVFLIILKYILRGGKSRRIIRRFEEPKKSTPPAYIPEKSEVIYKSKDGKQEKVFDALEWPAPLNNRHGTFALFSLSTIIPNNLLRLHSSI